MSRAKRRKQGERFAKIPVEVLEHPACVTLSGAAFRVMVVLAGQYSGRNNGTLACTEAWGKRFGISGTDTTRLALRELRDRGLIENTRPGMRMRKAPTLWALTWQPVDHRNGQPLDKPELASWRFRGWTQMAHPDNRGSDLADKSEFHPDFRGTVTPTTGVKQGSYTPICTAEQPSYTPMAGDTLRISAGRGHSRSVSCARSLNPGLEARVARFIGTQPHLTDNEIAHTFRKYSLDSTAVAAIRARAEQ